MLFHRADFQSVLLKRLGYPIHMSKRLASYDQSSSTEPITLTFADQTTATCDLLVGADGINSAVRRTLFSDIAESYAKSGDESEAQRIAEATKPVWSGQTAFRAVISADKLKSIFPGHRALSEPVSVRSDYSSSYPSSNRSPHFVVSGKRTCEYTYKDSPDISEPNFNPHSTFYVIQSSLIAG